jgi:hypothetical protein
LILEARGGIEPRAFPPSSFRFGLEDRRRERGPGTLPIVDCQLPIGPRYSKSALMQTSENDKSNEVQNQSAIGIWKSAMTLTGA